MSAREVEVYESCGCEVGNCTCYDCGVAGCDNYRDALTDRYCYEHGEHAGRKSTNGQGSGK